MSYILDALKRAQRERHLGQAPLADHVAQMPPPPAADSGSNRRLILALGGLLGLAVLVITLLLLRPHRAAPVVATDTRAVPVTTAAAPPAADNSAEHRDVTATDPATSAAPAADADAETAAAAAAAAAADTTATSARPPTAATLKATVNSLDDLTAPSAVPSERSVAREHSDFGRAHRTEAAAGAGSGSVRFSSTPLESSGTPDRPNGDPAPTSGTAASPSPSDAADESSPPPPATLPANDVPHTELPAPHDTTADTESLRRMPDNYQANFPHLNVQVHSYSDDTASSFVIIDGRSYHAGDTLSSGPHVIAIVPEGLVLSWQGHKVLYPVGR